MGNERAVVSKFSLDEDNLVKLGTFGGQDKPDNMSKLNKRVAEQELEVMDMHKLINKIKKEMKSLEAQKKEFKKKAEMAFEILESIYVDMNTGNESVTVKTYRKLEELCS